MTEDQDSYREAGADEVMVKPVMIQWVSCTFYVELGIDIALFLSATSKD